MQQNSEEPQYWKSLRYGYAQKTHNDRNSVLNSVTLRTDSHFTQRNSKCKCLKRSAKPSCPERSAKKYWQTLETICEDALRLHTSFTLHLREAPPPPFPNKYVAGWNSHWLRRRFGSREESLLTGSNPDFLVFQPAACSI